MNIVSPTGTVHRAEDDELDADGGTSTMCHYHGFGHFDITVYWPTTEKDVTCQNCQLSIAREKVREGNTR